MRTGKSDYKIIRVTPTLDAGTAYGAGEVLFNPTEIPNAVFHNGGASKLMSVGFIDYDNNNDAHGIDLYFFQLGTNDIGTLGGVIDITDPELLSNKFLGLVKVAGVANDASGDALLSKVASVRGVDLIVQAEDSSSSIFVAAVCDTSTVSTTAGKELIFGFEQL